MADFLTSTHRAKWIFTPQQLVASIYCSNFQNPSMRMFAQGLDWGTNITSEVPESNGVNLIINGLNEVIPEAKDVVRVDLVGGFALQKVTSERSYFRTIANMDIKLDFVPPSLINFISRQLISNGFRLYKKVAEFLQISISFILDSTDIYFVTTLCYP
ncbi:uncharacterized protein LOC107624424 isoform X1 [Arachis ipaensis]|nr:uncharacterized protein LOC107624424 isoform X1 [Arachis ipaensis]XP_020969457.1 uncharacterized protein LOC107624424 isoform X1 [Arachis ipaensis]XP_025684258.1 uncharacterized protein LOC112785066 isoform X1 [Arachis hypogaea]XP_025684259.1 uncharacterized protein LOC112785066 isoform X1 [Arachis hypogaea]